MKKSLKSLSKSQLIACCLISCLTNLQLASMAEASAPAQTQASKTNSKNSSSELTSSQVINEVESGTTKIEKSAVMLPKVAPSLATPTTLIAPQSGFEITTSYAHLEGEVQIKNLEGNSTFSSDGGNLTVAYGLGPHFYFGANIGYNTSKQRSDFAIAGQGSVQVRNSNGYSDPKLIAGSRMNFEKLSVVGRIEADISTGSAEEQRKPEQVTETNNKPGGSVYTPSVSLFTNDKSSIIFGSSLGYQIKQERKTTMKDLSGFQSEGKTTGGNTIRIEAFVETPQTTHSFGALLGWSKSESEKRVSLATVESAGSENLMGTGFANIRASNSISIIPSLSYLYYVNDKSGDVELKSQNVYMGSLSLRMNF